MATTVTIKGQVTIPKAMREAAGIAPGARVEVRLRPEGGVIVEAVDAVVDPERVAAERRRLEAAVERLRRRGVRPLLDADALLRATRGEA